MAFKTCAFTTNPNLAREKERFVAGVVEIIQKKLGSGELVLFAAVGAGVHYGGQLVRV